MIIKNYSDLSKKSEERKNTLSIVNEGLKSISPSSVFENKLSLKKNILKVENNELDLDKFRRIYVIGFGKASSEMAYDLEKILGTRIKKGIVIDITPKKLKWIKVKVGSHPYLSKKNIQTSKQIINMIKQLRKDDLLICLISGGGSALFEIPQNSFINTLKMNKRLLLSGASIHEINIIRKHISKVKGGKLASLTKANILSLIFSDVLGDNLNIIASGPTVRDESKVADAQKIIKKYKLPKIKFYETPRAKEIFSKIKNLIILNNETALRAMKEKSESLGYKTKIIDNKVSGEARKVAKRLLQLTKKMKRSEIYLLGGETTVNVKGKGKGGRNTELALSALESLPKDILLVSIDSDGIDNTDAAGAIIDEQVLAQSKSMNLIIKKYLKNNDSYNFFKKTNNLIFTGPTGSNVADLILILKK